MRKPLNELHSCWPIHHVPARLALQRVGERADRRRALAERQRVEEALAQAGVGQPALAVEVHEQRHVVRRPFAADDRLVVGDDEPARAQQRRQHRVELEAVAAAPVVAARRAISAASSSGAVSPSWTARSSYGTRRQVGAVQLAQPVDVAAGTRRARSGPAARRSLVPQGEAERGGGARRVPRLRGGGRSPRAVRDVRHLVPLDPQPVAAHRDGQDVAEQRRLAAPASPRPARRAGRRPRARTGTRRRASRSAARPSPSARARAPWPRLAPRP